MARRYLFLPVGLDRWDRRPWHPEPGTVVVKTQPHGCPRNGTMRHCFIAEESGRFLGLVLESSLQELQSGPLTRCHDCGGSAATLLRWATQAVLRPFCDACADTYANLGAEPFPLPRPDGPATGARRADSEHRVREGRHHDRR